MTITRFTSGPRNWNCFAFGKIWIDSMMECVAKWTLRINHINDKRKWAHIIIRLLSKEGEWTNNTYYEIDGLGQPYRKEIQIVGVTGWSQNLDLAFKKGDEIVLVLDTEKGNISLIRNGGRTHHVFGNIQRNENIKYKLGVWLYDHKYSVTLTNFDCKMLD